MVRLHLDADDVVADEIVISFRAIPEMLADDACDESLDFARRHPAHGSGTPGLPVEGEIYSEASLVTDRGGLWIARLGTHKRPGDNNDCWQLVVKKGEAVSPDKRSTTSQRRL